MNVSEFLKGYHSEEEDFYECSAQEDWQDRLTEAWDGTPEEFEKFLNENR